MTKLCFWYLDFGFNLSFGFSHLILKLNKEEIQWQYIFV